MNPFLHTRYVSPLYFCNREKESGELLQAVQAGRSATVYSIRRLGKTGLIHHLFYHLKEKKDIIPVYLDIYPTKSEEEFVNLLISKALFALEGEKENFLKKITSFFGKYRPKLSFDNLTGNPSLQLDIRTQEEVKISLDTLFNMVGESGKKVIIAIDEFQQVNQYNETTLPALLRSYLQEMPGLAIIFSGSKKSLLLKMFASPAEPLYHITQMFPLEKIDRKAYHDFIRFHFNQGMRIIQDTQIEDILNWTKVHTYYTQFFCHRLYEKTASAVREEDIEILKRQIFKEYEVIYYNFRQILTANQWRLLAAIGKEGIVKEPTSKAFLSKYSLGAHSTVRQSLNYLLDKELIYDTFDKEHKKEVYQVYDVFLSRWFELY